ncbi:MAG: zinc metallopeptidase [Coriobacteriales bacterium]
MYLYLAMVIIVVALGAFSQAWARHVYAAYADATAVRVSGSQMARRMLEAHALGDVAIARVGGKLSDRYEPSSRTVCLSRASYNGSGITAVTVSCHECGHAVQHQQGRRLLSVRSALYPCARLFACAWAVVAIVGFALANNAICLCGIALLALALLYQLIVLPTELEASGIALEYLKDLGSLDASQLEGCEAVLRAAAFTYLSGALLGIVDLALRIAEFYINP